MSEFVSAMRSSVSSPASAYIQFANDYPNGAHSAFVFVEDIPDIVVYQHILNIDGASFLGCGGKDGVLEVFEKLKTERRTARTCFIVDRDIEPVDKSASTEVLRTSSYSWENHLVEQAVMAPIIQRRSQPNLSNKDAATVVSDWCETLSSFEELLALHGAMLRCKKPVGLELELGSFPVVQGSVLDGQKLIPGQAAAEWIDERVDRLSKSGVCKDTILELSRVLRQGDINQWARGKTIFAIWRRFVPLRLNASGSGFVGELSASSVVFMIPHDNPAWRYVKDYAAERIAVAPLTAGHGAE